MWFTGIVVLAIASPILSNIDRYSPSFSENRNPKIYTLHTSVQFEEFIGVIEGKQMRLIIPAWCTFSKLTVRTLSKTLSSCCKEIYFSYVMI